MGESPGASFDADLSKALAEEIEEMREEVRELESSMTKQEAFIKLAQSSKARESTDPFAPNFKGENPWTRDGQPQSKGCSVS